MLQNNSLSASPAVESDITSIPNISTAKPKNIMPMVFFLSAFVNMIRKTPMTARTGVKVVGLKIFNMLNPSVPPID